MPEDKINFLQDIEDIPKKAVDPLAEEVLRRYNGAVCWQTTEQVNGKPLRQVLQECWEQQNGVLSCEDKKIAEELGVNVVVNLTALKTGIANAYLTDALTSGSAELPWLIMPTPRPDISLASKDELLVRIKQSLFEEDFQDSETMVEVVRQAKRVMARREKEKAERACAEMTSLMEDQCAEGGFSRALTDFLQYFVPYPFGVFSGPYIVRAPRLVWGTKKPRMATEIFPIFKAISPFDFCYSPDSPDTQRGTCVFTRELWTRKELFDAAKLPTYIKENVLEVLKECDSNSEFNLQWLSRAPDAPGRDIGLWVSNVRPIEVLHHYGTMSGRELAKYGFNDLESKDYYNCEIVMVGFRVIMVKVLRDPRLQTRPVYTASFYRTGGDKIAGDGVAQRLRDVERAYMANLRYLLQNSKFASAPLCEADYTRIAKYMGQNDIANVVPGMMYLADSSVASGGRPALNFFNVPANLQGYVQLLEMFMQLADRVTNIPAQLHGEAVGSGALRTFRGMSALQNNATKALHAAVDNMTYGIFSPLGTLLYNMNMLYSPDAAVKGDSQIITKGAEGMLHKEMKKQSAMEILQVLGTIGGQLGSMMNLAPVVGWSVKELMGAMDVPQDVLAAMMQPPAMLPQQGMPQAGGGNGINPNSNPNPEEGLTSQINESMAGLGNT